MSNYQVLYKQTWVTPRKAVLLGRGYLQYQLFDGTQAVARYGEWREKGKQANAMLPTVNDNDPLDISHLARSIEPFVQGEDDILEV